MSGEKPSRPQGPAEPIPLTIITGFLGSGKTTLLNALLRDPALRETAVLVNEVGEIGLDHLFYEAVDGDTMLLAGGCLCCSVRGDLVTALENILRGIDNGKTVSFQRVVIETTGLADPASVLHVVMAHPYLVQRFRLDGLVTTVDAVNGNDTLDRHQEAVKQAAMADRIVLTKTDLAKTSDVESLRARLKTLNPVAAILDAAKGEAKADTLLNAGLYDSERKIPDVKRWLAQAAVEEAEHEHHHHDGDHEHHHHHHHDDKIRTFSLASEKPIAFSTIEMFLDLLRATHGPKLLRLKGVVQLAEEPDQPLVLHVVQHIVHPPVRLKAWPDEDRRSRLVCVTYDLDPAIVRRLFDAFLGVPRTDTPDRAALTDNPLGLGRPT